MFFEYNEDTEKYDIPIYVHNPKIYEHTKEEVEDWIGLLKTEKVSAKSIFIDNDIIVDTKTWNTIKLNKYDEERLEKHRNYINNSLTSIIKPTYKKVDGIEEMIETGNFYIMENKAVLCFLFHILNFKDFMLFYRHNDWKNITGIDFAPSIRCAAPEATHLCNRFIRSQFFTN